LGKTANRNRMGGYKPATDNRLANEIRKNQLQNRGRLLPAMALISEIRKKKYKTEIKK
jgi:hypothetical protein